MRPARRLRSPIPADKLLGSGHKGRLCGVTAAGAQRSDYSTREGRGARQGCGRDSLHLSKSHLTRGRRQGRVAAGPCAVLHGSPQPATVSRVAGPCPCISEKAIPMAERVDSGCPGQITQPPHVQKGGCSCLRPRHMGVTESPGHVTGARRLVQGRPRRSHAAGLL